MMREGHSAGRTEALAAILIEIRDGFERDAELHRRLEQQLGKLQLANLGRAFDLIAAEREQIELRKRQLTSRDCALSAAEQAVDERWRRLRGWTIGFAVAAILTLSVGLLLAVRTYAPNNPWLCRAVGGYSGTLLDSPVSYCGFWFE